MSQKNSIHIGITTADRELSIKLLNTILAGEFVLLAQTLNYHWNLTGPEFHDYHLLFDAQYKAIFNAMDDIAERVRSIDGSAIGSMAAALKHSPIQEDLEKAPKPSIMVGNLLHQHEALIREIRTAINSTAVDNRDMGTSNFLTDLLEKHEKIAWMLRSLKA